MFGKLKEKLKGALSVFSRKAEEEAVEKKVEVAVEEKVRLEVEKKVEMPVEGKRAEAPVPKKKIAHPPLQEETKIEIPKIPELKKIVKEKIEGIKITYFVHGTTTDNEQNLCTGWNPGELSELGKQQCRQLKQLIGEQHFDVIFSSDLKRAIDSAKITFGDETPLIIRDQRLRECNYGDLNGQKEGRVNKEEHIDTPFPHGESYREVEMRMAEFLNETWKVHSGKHIAIVAHQAPQLALEVLLKGKSWEQAFREDWRNSKNWQPGWLYWMKDLVKLSLREVREIKKVEEVKEGVKEIKEDKKGFFTKIKETFRKEEIKKEEKKEIPAPEEKKGPEVVPLIKEEVKEVTKVKKETELKVEERKEEVPQEKKEGIALEKPPELKPEKGFFTKIKETITTKTISAEKFEELFWELELALLESNVSVEVIEKIKDDLKKELVDKPLPRDVQGKIEETLKKTLAEILEIEKIDLSHRIKQKKSQKTSQPYVIAFFGINGAGKTTSIAKLAHHFQKQGLSVVLAAGDTFRAAAIQQLEEHAQRLNARVIKHDYGADAAAVAFDAVKFAEKNGIDIVLIDTAGRLHSNTNLMQELEKIIRVAKPDLKLFVGESITGNDCIEQARQFDDLVELDGSILTKADVDEKGGAPLSIAYTIKKPILFLGTGQRYEDLEEFQAARILERLGL